MAKKYSLLEEIKDLIVEGIIVKIGKAFPAIAKKATQKLFKKYVWLIILGITGVLLLGIGVAEFISQYIFTWTSYLIVGAVLLLIGFIQFHS